MNKIHKLVHTQIDYSVQCAPSLARYLKHRFGYRFIDGTAGT